MARLTAVFDLQDRISGKLKAISDRFRTLDSMNVTPEVNVEDNTKGVIASIRERLSGLGNMAQTLNLSGGAQAFAKATVGAASELERQQISLEHFMEKGNPGMSKENAAKASQEYMAELKKNANFTPFSQGEVMAGGTRALQVAQGDPKQAKQLLTIAEDMAALTPGKSLEDAMEAIADAKMGEFERMKEFGLKFDAAKFAKVGWEGFMGEANGMFQGGAEKLSKSASGIMASIKGGLQGALQDAGGSALEKLKPHLESFSKWLQDGGGFEKIKSIAETAINAIVDGIIWLVQTGKAMWPMFQQILASLQPVFDGIVMGVKWVIANFDTIKPILLGVVAAFAAFSVISTVTTQVQNLTKAFQAVKAASSLMSMMGGPIFWIAAAIGLLFAAWQGNWFGIRDIVANVIAWLMPYLQAAMTFVMGVFNSVWTYIQSIMPMLQTIFQVVWGVISNVVVGVLTVIWTWVQIAFTNIWNIISLVMTTVWNYITLVWGIISGIFKAALQLLTGDVSGAWETIKQTFFNAIDNLKTLLSDFVSGAMQFGKDFLNGVKDGFLAVVDSVIETVRGIWEDITSIFSKKQTVKVGVQADGTGTDGSHKMGLNYVPFDGYIAELHKGEMVLTAQQAQMYRSGSLNFGGGPTTMPTAFAPEETASMLSSSPSGSSAVNNSSQVQVSTLVGAVHVHNEADEDRFIHRLKRLLEEELLTGGEGVYVG
ncbi:phage tail protein [Brevibacillus dissolubilis]|uniref:phage tail protein n=1 Tax=Brevibacillus dissolubilis TaxID=1844116 RepID=UPI001115E1E5|nr:hypothetical protein [Brevibacillus dissolubilis]